ncbi:MAG: hypothetical protein R2712_01515 [Vicinamibacterales bacterium]
MVRPGGALDLGDLEPSAGVLSEARKVQGLIDMARRAGIPADAPAPLEASAVDFLLEGLYAQKKISRTAGRGFHASDEARRAPKAERRPPVLTPDDDDDEEPGGGGGGGGRRKKRYYN